MEFGLFFHLLHLFVTQIGGVLDGDFLFFAGTFVFGIDMQNTWGVNIEGNFDLGNSARSGGNPIEDKAAEGFVVGGHRTLTLQDIDFNLRLIVAGGTKDLALAGRDGGVTVD